MDGEYMNRQKIFLQLLTRTFTNNLQEKQVQGHCDWHFSRPFAKPALLNIYK
jgi:hypothetical protein